MTTVRINARMSPFEIDVIFREAFARTDFCKYDTTKLDGWRCLVRLKSGQGRRERLKPMEIGVGGELKFDDIVP